MQEDKSTKKMEGLDFYYAHDEGKSVWSHCVVTTHIVSAESSYAWDFRTYFREEYCKAHNLPFKSKNDLATEMIQAYETDEDEGLLRRCGLPNTAGIFQTNHRQRLPTSSGTKTAEGNLNFFEDYRRLRFALFLITR